MSSYCRHVSIVHESLALNDHDDLSAFTACRGLLILIHVLKLKVWQGARCIGKLDSFLLISSV